MDKLKVCHITSVHNRYDIRVFRKECCSLAEHGFDVTLLVNDELPDEVLSGVKIVSTRSPYRSRLSRLTRSRQALYRAAIEADAEIYHLHDPDLLPLGNRLRRSKKMVVFDSHEVYPLQLLGRAYIPRRLRPLVAGLYKSYETRSVRRFDAVVTPCSMEGEDPFAGRSRRTVLLNNAPVLADYYDQYEPVPRTGDAVCYTGSLSYARGITQLAQAADQAGVTLILAGEFDSDSYRAELEADPAWRSVDYRGFVDKAELLAIYQEARIGVSTLLDVGQHFRADNLATKVYEYMAMELPVIVSDYPYARDVMADYPFGILVDPADSRAIADAIRYLLAHPEAALEMGRAGRRAVRERFNWPVEFEKLLALYAQLADSRQPGTEGVKSGSQDWKEQRG